MNEIFDLVEQEYVPIFTNLKIYKPDDMPDMSTVNNIHTLDILTNGIKINGVLFIINNDNRFFNFIVRSNDYNYMSYTVDRFGRYYYITIKSLTHATIKSDKLWMFVSTQGDDGLFVSFSNGDSTYVDASELNKKIKNQVINTGSISTPILRRIYSSGSPKLMGKIKDLTMEYGDLYIPDTNTKNPSKILIENVASVSESGYINSVISKGFQSVLPRYVTPIFAPNKKLAECYSCGAKNSFEQYFINIGYCRCKRCGNVSPRSYNEAILKANIVT